ncbi:MAG: Na(+)/H(+) antiporter subunit D [Pseudomonadota bacterium]
MIEMLPPGLVLLFGAILIGLTRGRLRDAVALTIPIVTAWLVWQVPDGVVYDIGFLDYRIEPLEGSPVRRLFATIFSLMAFIGALFALRQAKWFEIAAAFAYAAGAVGVCFAGDLITLFLFWELMAIFSTAIVWCGGSREARAAGIRYAMLHLLGGVLLKVGIEGTYVHTGSLDIQPVLATNFDTWMMLIGILINAAAPPVSAWLADAYPRSSATGSVFLSAYTTKTAVLALILLFPGEKALIWIGLYMALYGIVYALLENDIRRILAYSIVNQVGFMVCAIGIGTELAINGAAAHAFAHIVYKALLFMSAGVVILRTGMNRCSDVGGLFRTMPLTTVCCIVGALAISGFPLTSGFTTKTMISQAAANEGLVAVYFVLAAASAGVFLHAGIKFPWFVFFQKDSGLRPKDAPWNMAAAMVLAAGACIVLGVAPGLLYSHLPFPVEYTPYTPAKVVSYLQLLLFAGLAFFMFLPLMRRTLTISLDLDWVWRVLLFRTGALLFDLAAAGKRVASGTFGKALAQVHRLAHRLMGIPEGLERPGVLARTWPIGITAIWIIILLIAYILFYYL